MQKRRITAISVVLLTSLSLVSVSTFADLGGKTTVTMVGTMDIVVKVTVIKAIMDTKTKGINLVNLQ